MPVTPGTRVGSVATALRAATVPLALAMALPLAATTARAQSARDVRSEAIRLYNAGQFAEALPLFDQVLARHPHDIEARNKRGCIYIRMDQPARALGDFEEATRISPFLAYDAAALDHQYAPDVAFNPGVPGEPSLPYYPSAVSNRGIAHLLLGQVDEARADFQQAIDLRRQHRVPAFSPNYQTWRAGLAASYCGLGQVGLERGDANAALEAFNEAISFYPADPNAFVGRGRALATLGKLPEALNDYNEALRLDPNHSRALGFRAATLDRLGHTLEAVGDLGASIRLDPNVSTSRRLRAAYLARLGRIDEAIRELDDVVRLDPGDAAALKDRGALLVQKGDPARALTDLDAAITLNPRSDKAFQNRAGTYNALGRFTEALADCDAALQLDPRNAGALNNRGLAHLGLAQYEAAVTDLSAAITINPQLASAYLNRGGALLQLGRHDEAAADYALAVRLDPKLSQAYSSPEAVAGLVQLRTRPPRDDLAVRQAPEPSQSFLDRGNLRRAACDWAGAIAEYTRAVDADPKCTDALALRGWARFCTGTTGAGDDVRAWFRQSNWRDPMAPSVALLGILTARRDGHDDLARQTLDEALANLRPTDWPVPLFHYLKRDLTDTALLSTANDPDKLTLARAVIGMDLLLRGYHDAALDQLRWVRNHGRDRTIGRDLAVETLRHTETSAR